jgi:type IV secretory pathway TrbL component
MGLLWFKIIEYKLSKTLALLSIFKMTISSTKTKSMAMCGNIQSVKIVIDDKIIEQVTEFKYLGYCI